MTRGGEKIVAAAVMFDGMIWTVPRPGRHHDVLRRIREEYTKANDIVIQPDEQGFLTSENRFVGRWRAYRFARDAGQLITSDRSTTLMTELYSEDLW